MLRFLAILLLCPIAHAAEPPCWHDSRTGAKLDWRTDSASFAIAWLCNVNGIWTPYGLYGQYDELANDYIDASRDFLHASETERKAAWALWEGRYTNPLRDLSGAKAMFSALTASLQPPKVIDTRAYYLVQLKNKPTLVEGGKVPIGTICAAESVNGFRAVSVVTWTGGSHLVALADCK